MNEMIFRIMPKLVLYFSYLEYERQLFVNVANKHRCGRPNQRSIDPRRHSYVYFFQPLDSIARLVS